MGTIAVIAGVILVVLLLGILDYAAAEVGRSPERESQRPRYKARWQAVGVLASTGLTLAAYFYISSTAAAVAVGILFASYALFRHFLRRSAAMQRYFLTAPLFAAHDSSPATGPTRNDRSA